MTTQNRPRAPARLHPAGRRLWLAVVEAYELDEHELLLLGQAARTADLCESLHERVDADGAVVEVDGHTRTHPAAVELRQQRIVLARLLAALRIPTSASTLVPIAGRGQRRGTRGVYAIRPLDPTGTSDAQAVHNAPPADDLGGEP